MAGECWSMECSDESGYRVRISGNFKLEGASIVEEISSRNYCACHVVEAVKETPHLGRVEVYRLGEGPKKEIGPNTTKYDSAGRMIFSSRGMTLNGNLPKLEAIISSDVIDILRKSVSFG